MSRFCKPRLRSPFSQVFMVVSDRQTFMPFSSSLFMSQLFLGMSYSSLHYRVVVQRDQLPTPTLLTLSSTVVWISLLTLLNDNCIMLIGRQL